MLHNLCQDRLTGAMQMILSLLWKLFEIAKLVVLQKNADQVGLQLENYLLLSVRTGLILLMFSFLQMSFTLQKVIGQSWKRQQFNCRFKQNLGMIAKMIWISASVLEAIQDYSFKTESTQLQCIGLLGI
jgi:hypothetical protein